MCSDSFWRKDGGRVEKEADMNEGVLGGRSSTYGYCEFSSTILILVLQINLATSFIG